MIFWIFRENKKIWRSRARILILNIPSQDFNLKIPEIYILKISR